ncbi:MAG: C25 family cysteine peptidase, partial [Candidatus Krumholzibacteria bacterium]|nr:C25 family cysteine peptidase [Candidatus Krumholzibacteria bacterium]
EKPGAGDFWRRRMIRIADDRWSGTGTTCDVGDDFQTPEEFAATTTENSLAGGYDVVRFFLSDRISHPADCVSSFAQTQLTRLEATPVLLGEMSKGATIVSFQAHMNRYLITHEWLFTSSSNLGPPDYANVLNTGRPFILFGMGCHMSDYAVHRELLRASQSGPNGDCLSELLLLLDNKGAVCTYASTGFEFLRPNSQYTAIITRVFFTDPPTAPVIPSDRSQARWIMGEVMTAAEIEDLLLYPNGPGLGAKGQAKRYHILGDPLLRIDAGPPRFEVTVDDQPFDSGDLLLSTSAGDSVEIRAVIADEVAIDTLSLEIDGIDATNQMTVTPLVDIGLDAARKYEVTFKHKILPKTYDIILRAHQAADTTANDYHMVAEFVFKVQLDVALRINGRPVIDGDLVPARGDYVFELRAPLVIDPGLIRVRVDTTDIAALDFSHPSPQDSTTWLVGFSATLEPGAHRASVFVDNAEFAFNLAVGTDVGVRDLIAYPNPFADETYFVYSNDVEISDGKIDIFTTSGKKVARLPIPLSARAVGQNAVRWDGKTWDGGDVANGVYLFVVSIDQGGQKTTHRGKLMRTR